MEIWPGAVSRGPCQVALFLRSDGTLLPYGVW